MIKDVVVEVKEVRDKCPIFKIGDRFIVSPTEGGGWALDISSSTATKICMSTLPALIVEMVKMRYGMQERSLVHCIDPGPPYTENSVIFEIRCTQHERKDT